MPQLIHRIPSGARVRVRQKIERRGRSWETVVEGVVVAHELEPTGSWFAHGKNDRLWLPRLRLRKDDGELTTLNLDRYSVVEVL